MDTGKLGQQPVSWWLELAAALTDVEEIAARGGAYALAQRASQLAATLRVAETLNDAKAKADAARFF